MKEMILASIFDKETNEFIPIGIFDSYKDFVKESKKYPDIKFFDSKVKFGEMDLALIADYN